MRSTSVQRIRETISWGEGFGDRVRIASFYGLRFAAGFVSRRRRRTRGTYPELWIADVMVSNPIGRFLCRARTVDFDIVNPNVEGMEVVAFRGILTALAQPKPVVLDIGAHIGKFSVLAGKALRGPGRVLAFEPEPSNFELLTKNIELNGLSNVQTYNVACGEEDGEAGLFLCADNTGAHSMATRIGEKEIRIQVRKLDTLLPELGVEHVDLIKLDVEHAEADVIRGARGTLENSPNVTIFFEEMQDPATADSILLLRKLGFHIKLLAWKAYIASRSQAVIDKGLGVAERA